MPESAAKAKPPIDPPLMTHRTTKCRIAAKIC